MNIEVIKEKVINVIKENCPYDTENFDITADLRDNYGIDSIAIVTVLVDLEEAFDITIDSQLLTYDSFSTIEKIIDYVVKSIN